MYANKDKDKVNDSDENNVDRAKEGWVLGTIHNVYWQFVVTTVDNCRV